MNDDAYAQLVAVLPETKAEIFEPKEEKKILPELPADVAPLNPVSDEETRRGVSPLFSGGV